MYFFICKFKGGELFAKRRKKADKWVVDETSIGSTAPSQFADHFLQQQSFQQKLFQEQQEQEKQVNSKFFLSKLKGHSKSI
jgi:hypothetical protein